MQKLILMMAGITALAVGVWLAVEDGAEAPPEPLPLPLAQGDAAGSAPAPDHSVGDAKSIDTVPLPPEVPEEHRGCGMVAGLLLDVEGAPAKGALVTLHHLSEGKGGRTRSDRPPLVTHADRRGRFSFQGLLLGTWRLDADDGLHSLAEPRKTVISKEHASISLDLQLAAGSRLRGLVRGTAGELLSGVVVTLRSIRGKEGAEDPIRERVATSDETGGFVFGGLRDRIHYWLKAAHADRFLDDGGGNFLVDGDAEVQLVMGEWASLAGRVEDGEGVALAGVEVELAERFAGRSDDTGAFVIEHIVPAARPMDLLGVSSDRDLVGRAKITLEEGERHAGLVFRLRRSARVKGRVTDSSGRGVAGASINAHGTGGRPSHSGVAARSGQPAAEHARRVKFLRALRQDRAMAVRAEQAQAERAARASRERDRSAMTVSGTREWEAASREAAAAAGWVAFLTEEMEARASQLASESAWRSGQITTMHLEISLWERLYNYNRWIKTDDGGFYEILGLIPEAPYDLYLSARGFLASERTAISLSQWGEEEIVNQVLHRGAVVRGSTGATFGGPSSELSFEIQLVDLATSKVQGYRQQAGRTYELSGIRPGRYGLRARTSLRRGLVALGPHLVLEADRVYENVDLHFEPGACVSGRVSDAFGRPIPGAILVIRIPKVASRKTQTDATGGYRLDGLFPGTYRLELRARGGSPNVKSVEVELLAGQEIIHDFSP